MADPGLRSAKRRLAAILADEDYGPKLARLNRTDERKVLDLIEANQGKEARKLILELDETRRARRNVVLRAKLFAKRTKSDRQRFYGDVVADIADDEEVVRRFWAAYDGELVS